MATENPQHDAKVGDMNVESADGPVSSEDIAQQAGGCVLKESSAVHRSV